MSNCNFVETGIVMSTACRPTSTSTVIESLPENEGRTSPILEESELIPANAQVAASSIKHQELPDTDAAGKEVKQEAGEQLP